MTGATGHGPGAPGRRRARAAHAHALLDRLRARCSPSLARRCRCSRGRRRRAFAMGDANATNFRYLNHFFEINQRAVVPRVDAIQRRYQGIPWVNTIAADSARRGLLRRHRRGPERHRTTRRAAATRALGRATFQPLGLPVLDGSRSECDWDTDPDAVAPGIFGPGAACRRCSATTTCTNSQRQLLAVEPRAAARGLRPDHRRRADGARAAHAHRAGRIVDGRSSRRRRSRARTLQDTVFANRQYAGELWRDDARRRCASRPDAPAQRPGRRQRRLPGARELGPARRPRLATARSCSAASRRARWRRSSGVAARRRLFTTPFDATDPVNTPRGLNTDEPAGAAQALADAVTDLDGPGIPLDAPLRDFQYEKRGDERIPIHGGPGDPRASSTRSTSRGARRGLPERPARLELRAWPSQFDGPSCPDAAHDPHLLAVDRTRPRRTSPTRPDVLAQGVGRPGLLRARDPRRPRLTIQRFGKVRCTSRRTITYRLPLRKRGERMRTRARDGQRQAGEDPSGSAGAACAISLRGRPKGALPDPRDREDVAQAHDQARPAARARARRSRREGQAVRRALAARRRCWRSCHAGLGGAVRPRPMRRATSRRPTSARRSTPRPSTRRCSRRSPPPTRRGGEIAAADPERSFVGQTLCWSTARAAPATRACTTGSRRTTARSQPVVFTARNGATLSGRVWFTRAGPAQAARGRDRQRLRAGARDALLVRRAGAREGGLRGAHVRPAEPGPLGLARRDARQQEGFPAQSDGRPFFDGARGRARLLPLDAVGAVRPRPSCNSGTSHVAQAGAARRRRASTPAFNPLWRADRHPRIGIAGHSYGAGAASPTSASATRA